MKWKFKTDLVEVSFMLTMIALGTIAFKLVGNPYLHAFSLSFWLVLDSAIQNRLEAPVNHKFIARILSLATLAVILSLS